MRETKPRVLAEPKPIGVIDVLTAGFDLVRRRPLTIAIPVLIDGAIWLLPRLSLGDLFRPAIDQAINQMMVGTDLPPDAAASVQQMRDGAAAFFGSLNLLGMVSFALDTIARVPSLLAFDGGGVHSPLTPLAFTFSIPSGLFAVLLFAPLFLLGLFAAAAYIELIAQGVRPLSEDSRTATVVRICLLWFRLIGLAFIFFALLMGLVFVLMLAQLFAPPGTDAGSFFFTLAVVGWIWISIYFFFAISGMAVSQVGLLESLRRSVFILRIYFWPSLLLIALTVIVERGLGLIWSGLTSDPLGVPVGILANAFIGTSLLAASMVYYQDRMNAIQRLVAQARAAATRRTP